MDKYGIEKCRCCEKVFQKKSACNFYCSATCRVRESVRRYRKKQLSEVEIQAKVLKEESLEEKQKRKARDTFGNRRRRCAEPEKCSFCGVIFKYTSTTRHFDAHHEDYNKPFEVIFFCKPCHSKLHLLKKGLNEITEGEKKQELQDRLNKVIKQAKQKTNDNTHYCEACKKLRFQVLAVSQEEIITNEGMEKRWLCEKHKQSFVEV